jgi:hypothetical protein
VHQPTPGQFGQHPDDEGRQGRGPGGGFVVLSASNTVTLSGPTSRLATCHVPVYVSAI